MIFTSMFDTATLSLNAKFQQCHHSCCTVSVNLLKSHFSNSSESVMIPNESKCLAKSFLQQKAAAAGVICSAFAEEFGLLFTPTCSGEVVEEVHPSIQ